MRLIPFQVDENTPVYVNPLLVRAVTPEGASQARIHFDQHHFVVVREKAEMVAHAIENVR